MYQAGLPRHPTEWKLTPEQLPEGRDTRITTREEKLAVLEGLNVQSRRGPGFFTRVPADRPPTKRAPTTAESTELREATAEYEAETERLVEAETARLEEAGGAAQVRDARGTMGMYELPRAPGASPRLAVRRPDDEAAVAGWVIFEAQPIPAAETASALGAAVATNRDAAIIEALAADGVPPAASAEEMAEAVGLLLSHTNGGSQWFFDNVLGGSGRVVASPFAVSASRQRAILQILGAALVRGDATFSRVIRAQVPHRLEQGLDLSYARQAANNIARVFRRGTAEVELPLGQYHTLLERFRDRSTTPGDFDSLKAFLQEGCDGRFSTQNHTRVLVDGEFNEWFVDKIKNARSGDTITLQHFANHAADERGLYYLLLMAEAAQRGVKFHICFDAIGTTWHDPQDGVVLHLFSQLFANISVEENESPVSRGEHNHCKSISYVPGKVPDDGAEAVAAREPRRAEVVTAGMNLGCDYQGSLSEAERGELETLMAEAKLFVQQKRGAMYAEQEGMAGDEANIKLATDFLGLGLPDHDPRRPQWKDQATVHIGPAAKDIVETQGASHMIAHDHRMGRKDRAAGVAYATEHLIGGAQEGAFVAPPVEAFSSSDRATKAAELVAGLGELQAQEQALAELYAHVTPSMTDEQLAGPHREIEEAEAVYMARANELVELERRLNGGEDVCSIMHVGNAEDANHLAALLKAIGTAQVGDDICMCYPYFGHGELSAALRAAAKRGVHVVTLMPEHNDVAQCRDAARSYYQEWTEDGIETYEYTGEPTFTTNGEPGRMAHRKFFVLRPGPNTEAGFIMDGSTNGDYRSLHIGSEQVSCRFGAAAATKFWARHVREDIWKYSKPQFRMEETTSGDMKPVFAPSYEPNPVAEALWRKKERYI